MEEGSGSPSPTKSVDSSPRTPLSSPKHQENVSHGEMVSPMHSFNEADDDDEPRTSLGDEVWGAKMFLQSVRSRLRSKKVFESLEMRANYPDRDFTKLPDGWNVSTNKSNAVPSLLLFDLFLIIRLRCWGPLGLERAL